MNPVCPAGRRYFQLRLEADNESAPRSMMKSSIDHLPERKQRELARIVAILLEELQDALNDATAEFKKKGRILKIILFGSYARGDWVDEPHTMKGYRSDYDLLIIVNNRKLTDFASYWYGQTSERRQKLFQIIR